MLLLFLVAVQLLRAITAHEFFINDKQEQCFCKHSTYDGAPERTVLNALQQYPQGDNTQNGQKQLYDIQKRPEVTGRVDQSILNGPVRIEGGYGPGPSIGFGSGQHEPGEKTQNGQKPQYDIQMRPEVTVGLDQGILNGPVRIEGGGYGPGISIGSGSEQHAPGDKTQKEQKSQYDIQMRPEVTKGQKKPEVTVGINKSILNGPVRIEGGGYGPGISIGSGSEQHAPGDKTQNEQKSQYDIQIRPEMTMGLDQGILNGPVRLEGGGYGPGIRLGSGSEQHAPGDKTQNGQKPQYDIRMRPEVTVGLDQNKLNGPVRIEGGGYGPGISLGSGSEQHAPIDETQNGQKPQYDIQTRPEVTKGQKRPEVTVGSDKGILSEPVRIEGGGYGPRIRPGSGSEQHAPGDKIQNGQKPQYDIQMRPEVTVGVDKGILNGPVRIESGGYGPRISLGFGSEQHAPGDKIQNGQKPQYDIQMRPEVKVEVDQGILNGPVRIEAGGYGPGISIGSGSEQHAPGNKIQNMQKTQYDIQMRPEMTNGQKRPEVTVGINNGILNGPVRIDGGGYGPGISLDSGSEQHAPGFKTQNGQKPQYDIQKGPEVTMGQKRPEVTLGLDQGILNGPVRIEGGGYGPGISIGSGSEQHAPGTKTQNGQKPQYDIRMRPEVTVGLDQNILNGPVPIEGGGYGPGISLGSGSEQHAPIDETQNGQKPQYDIQMRPEVTVGLDQSTLNGPVRIEGGGYGPGLSLGSGSQQHALGDRTQNGQKPQYDIQMRPEVKVGVNQGILNGPVRIEGGGYGPGISLGFGSEQHAPGDKTQNGQEPQYDIQMRPEMTNGQKRPEVRVGIDKGILNGPVRIEGGGFGPGISLGSGSEQHALGDKTQNGQKPQYDIQMMPEVKVGVDQGILNGPVRIEGGGYGPGINIGSGSEQHAPGDKTQNGQKQQYDIQMRPEVTKGQKRPEVTVGIDKGILNEPVRIEGGGYSPGLSLGSGSEQHAPGDKTQNGQKPQYDIQMRPEVKVGVDQGILSGPVRIEGNGFGPGLNLSSGSGQHAPGDKTQSRQKPQYDIQMRPEVTVGKKRPEVTVGIDQGILNGPAHIEGGGYNSGLRPGFGSEQHAPEDKTQNGQKPQYDIRMRPEVTVGLDQNILNGPVRIEGGGYNSGLRPGFGSEQHAPIDETQNGQKPQYDIQMMPEMTNGLKRPEVRVGIDHGILNGPVRIEGGGYGPGISLASGSEQHAPGYKTQNGQKPQYDIQMRSEMTNGQKRPEVTVGIDKGILNGPVRIEGGGFGPGISLGSGSEQHAPGDKAQNGQKQQYDIQMRPEVTKGQKRPEVTVGIDKGILNEPVRIEGGGYSPELSLGSGSEQHAPGDKIQNEQKPQYDIQMRPEITKRQKRPKVTVGIDKGILNGPVRIEGGGYGLEISLGSGSEHHAPGDKTQNGQKPQYDIQMRPEVKVGTDQGIFSGPVRIEGNGFGPGLNLSSGSGQHAPGEKTQSRQKPQYDIQMGPEVTVGKKRPEVTVGVDQGILNGPAHIEGGGYNSGLRPGFGSKQHAPEDKTQNGQKPQYDIRMRPKVTVGLDQSILNGPVRIDGGGYGPGISLGSGSEQHAPIDETQNGQNPQYDIQMRPEVTVGLDQGILNGPVRIEGGGYGPGISLGSGSEQHAPVDETQNEQKPQYDIQMTPEVTVGIDKGILNGPVRIEGGGYGPGLSLGFGSGQHAPGDMKQNRQKPQYDIQMRPEVTVGQKRPEVTVGVDHGVLNGPVRIEGGGYNPGVSLGSGSGQNAPAYETQNGQKPQNDIQNGPEMTMGQKRPEVRVGVDQGILKGPMRIESGSNGLGLSLGFGSGQHPPAETTQNGQKPQYDIQMRPKVTMGQKTPEVTIGVDQGIVNGPVRIEGGGYSPGLSLGSGSGQNAPGYKTQNGQKPQYDIQKGPEVRVGVDQGILNGPVRIESGGNGPGLSLGFGSGQDAPAETTQNGQKPQYDIQKGLEVTIRQKTPEVTIGVDQNILNGPVRSEGDGNGLGLSLGFGSGQHAPGDITQNAHKSQYDIQMRPEVTMAQQGPLVIMGQTRPEVSVGVDQNILNGPVRIEGGGNSPELSLGFGSGQHAPGDNTQNAQKQQYDIQMRPEMTMSQRGPLVTLGKTRPEVSVGVDQDILNGPVRIEGGGYGPRISLGSGSGQHAPRDKTQNGQKPQYDIQMRPEVTVGVEQGILNGPMRIKGGGYGLGISLGSGSGQHTPGDYTQDGQKPQYDKQMRPEVTVGQKRPELTVGVDQGILNGPVRMEGGGAGFGLRPGSGSGRYAPRKTTQKGRKQLYDTQKRPEVIVDHSINYESERIEGGSGSYGSGSRPGSGSGQYTPIDNTQNGEKPKMRVEHGIKYRPVRIEDNGGYRSGSSPGFGSGRYAPEDNTHNWQEQQYDIQKRPKGSMGVGHGIKYRPVSIEDGGGYGSVSRRRGQYMRYRTRPVSRHIGLDKRYRVAKYANGNAAQHRSRLAGYRPDIPMQFVQDNTEWRPLRRPGRYLSGSIYN